MKQHSPEPTSSPTNQPEAISDPPLANPSPSVNNAINALSANLITNATGPQNYPPHPSVNMLSHPTESNSAPATPGSLHTVSGDSSSPLPIGSPPSNSKNTTKPPQPIQHVPDDVPINSASSSFQNELPDTPIKTIPDSTRVQCFIQRSLEEVSRTIQQVNDCGMNFSERKAFAGVSQKEIVEESRIYNRRVTNSARVRVIERDPVPLYCSYECRLADTNASRGIVESDYNLGRQSPPPVPHSSASSLVFSTSQDSESDSTSAANSSVELTDTDHCHARFAPLYGFPPLHALTIIPPAPESSTGIRLLTSVMSQSMRSATSSNLPIVITSSTPVGPIVDIMASSSQVYYFNEPSLADMLSNKGHHSQNIEPFVATTTIPASPSTHFRVGPQSACSNGSSNHPFNPNVRHTLVSLHPPRRANRDPSKSSLTYVSGNTAQPRTRKTAAIAQRYREYKAIDSTPTPQHQLSARLNLHQVAPGEENFSLPTSSVFLAITLVHCASLNLEGSIHSPSSLQPDLALYKHSVEILPK